MHLLIAFLISGFLSLFFFLFFRTQLLEKVEVAFYEPQVLQSLRSELAGVSEETQLYLEELESQFSPLLESGVFAEVLDEVQADSDIQLRNDWIERLQEEFPELLGARLIRLSDNSIHFSSFTDDFRFQNGVFADYRLYRPNPNTEEWKAYKRFGDPTNFEEINITVQGAEETIAIGVKKEFDQQKTITYFFVGLDGLRDRILEKRKSLQTALNLNLITNVGVVLNLSGLNWTRIREIFPSLLDENGQLPSKLVKFRQDQRDLFVLSYQGLSVNTTIAFPVSNLKMPIYLKALLYFVLMCVLFLILFLVKSFWPDRISILRRQVQIFQQKFIKEFFDLEGNNDWSLYQKRLSEYQKSYQLLFRESLGLNQGVEDAEVDLLLNNSWASFERFVNSYANQQSPPVTQQNLKASLENVLTELLEKNSLRNSSQPLPSPASSLQMKKIGLSPFAKKRRKTTSLSEGPWQEERDQQISPVEVQFFDEVDRIENYVGESSPDSSLGSFSWDDPNQSSESDSSSEEESELAPQDSTENSVEEIEEVEEIQELEQEQKQVTGQEIKSELSPTQEREAVIRSIDQSLQLFSTIISKTNLDFSEGSSFDYLEFLACIKSLYNLYEEHSLRDELNENSDIPVLVKQMKKLRVRVNDYERETKIEKTKRREVQISELLQRLKSLSFGAAESMPYSDEDEDLEELEELGEELELSDELEPEEEKKKPTLSKKKIGASDTIELNKALGTIRDRKKDEGYDYYIPQTFADDSIQSEKLLEVEEGVAAGSDSPEEKPAEME